MFDLNKQNQQRSEEASSGGGLYARDVRILRMSLKDERADILFKILPAFDPSTAVEMQDGSVRVDPTSMVTFRDAADQYTPWARYIYVSGFTGHGPVGPKGGRRDLISLRSYSDDPSTFCPVQALMSAISSDSMWRYLQEDLVDEPQVPGGKAVVRERAAINPKLSARLLCNVVNCREPQSGVMLGEFPTSALPSLFGERGLATMPNMMVSEEMIAQNPMYKWAVGDLTDPGRGPVLKLRKDTASGKGKYAQYIIELALHNAGVNNGKPYSFAIDPAMLPQRYNLLDLNSVIAKPTEEGMVAQLVSLFNQWNPSRTRHEYELLREVFGHAFRIPDPPVRGSVQGFGAPPQAGSSALPPQGQPQFGGYPGMGGSPAIPQQQAHVPGLPRAQQAQQPMQELPGIGPQNSFPPPPAQNFGPMTGIPHAPQAPSPAVQQALGAAQTSYAPKAPQTPPPVQQGYMQPPPQGVPMPGDPVPKYDREAFLNQVKTTAARK